MTRYQLVSKDDGHYEWELGEIILDGAELDKALHGLIRTTQVTNLVKFEGKPVFIQRIAENAPFFISFKEIQ